MHNVYTNKNPISFTKPYRNSVSNDNFYRIMYGDTISQRRNASSLLSQKVRPCIIEPCIMPIFLKWCSYKSIKNQLKKYFQKMHQKIFSKKFIFRGRQVLLVVFNTIIKICAKLQRKNQRNQINTSQMILHTF